MTNKNLTYAESIAATRNDVEDTSVVFSTFEDAAMAEYTLAQWNPPEEVDNIVRFAYVIEAQYTGGFDATGNSHYGALLGLGRHNAAGKDIPLVLGLEGRAGVLAGTAGVAAGLVGALDIDSENGGTAVVGTQIYLPPYTLAEMAHYDSPYKIFAPGTQLDSRIDGRLLLGIGQADARMTASGVADSATGVVGNVGTGEDTLHSYTLPADALSDGGVAAVPSDGRAIRFKGCGYTANNANAKNLKIYFGSTVVLSHDFATSVLEFFEYELIVVRESEGQQRAFCRLTTTGAAGVAINAFGAASPTEDETLAIVVKSTAEATDDSDITELFAITEFMN